MAIFKGAAVAIVTPMHEDGKVNSGISDCEQHRCNRYLWHYRRVFYIDTWRTSPDHQICN